MSGYIGPIPVPQGIQEKQTFTATAGQTTFNTNGYTDGAFINVFLNGVRLVNGTDYTATNGSDVVLTSGANASDVLDFETINDVQLVSNTSTTPIFKTSATLKNDTEEDTDGGRESTLIFKGEQSGGEISTLAEIEASHDGTADDEKGDLIFRTNDGSDGSSPTERMRIDSGGNIGVNINAPSSMLHLFDGGTDTGITLQSKVQASATSSVTFMSRDSSNVNQTATIKNNSGTLELDSKLDVSYAGGGDFIALFQNTTDATPYGIHVKDAASGANGYPLFQVTSGDGTDVYFRVDSGTGRVFTPNQPSFLVQPSSTQGNISVGVANTIAFGTERFDVGNNFASNTFTAPSTGKYHFDAQFRLESMDTAAAYYHLNLLTSNRNYFSIIAPKFSSDPSYMFMTISVTADMDANDTASMTLFQSGGSAQTDISTDSFFSGILIG